MITQLNPTKRKVKKDGTLSKTAEFTATFIKANGQLRTMHFAASVDKINGYIANGTMATVYDVENAGIRRFNFANLQGSVTQVN